MPLPLGIFDLDADGTVLYYRAKPNGVVRGADIAGRSFYDVVAEFDHAGELRRRVDAFLRGGRQPAISFDFTCCPDTRNLPLRVVLARVREGSVSGNMKAVLLLASER